MPTKRSISQDGGVRTIYLVSALTFVNSVLGAAGSSISFLFSLFFPYLAAVRRDIGFLGLSGPACLIIYSILPTVLFAALGFLASKEYEWATPVAAAVTAADLIYMIIFSVRYGIVLSLIINILFHVWMTYSLTVASIASNSGFTAEEGARISDHLSGYKVDEGFSPIQATGPVSEAVGEKSFRFDAEYAKRNGSLKTIRIALTIAIYVVAATLSFFVSFIVLDMSESTSALALPAGLLLMAVCTAVFIAEMVKLSPYIEQRQTVYSVSESGVLCAEKFDIPPFNHIVYDDLKVLEKEPDHWVISFLNRNGKEKKAVIPRSYPGLDEILSGMI